ncbi:MAG: polysaccharide deacetylase family protein [Christensenellaceae bacterium]
MKLTIKASRKITYFIIGILIVFVGCATLFSTKTVAITGSESFAPIYNGNREGNSVALMFNVYENSENVKKIIGKLKEYNYKATFFVGGCWADDNNDAIAYIIESGNEIANHGYFHKNHKKLDLEQNISEIKNNHELIKGICGVEMKLFAPPSGAFNKDTLKASEMLGYKTIMWTKDTIDWRDKDVEKIVSRATKNLIGGDLVLMHPKDQTVVALDRILKYINEQGMVADTVSHVIAEYDL